MREIWTAIADKGAQIIQPQTDNLVGILLAQVIAIPCLCFSNAELWCLDLVVVRGYGGQQADRAAPAVQVRTEHVDGDLQENQSGRRDPFGHAGTADPRTAQTLAGRSAPVRTLLCAIATADSICVCSGVQDGASLIKGLNILVLKVLENADRTSSFIILINFLKYAFSCIFHFAVLI